MQHPTNSTETKNTSSKTEEFCRMPVQNNHIDKSKEIQPIKEDESVTSLHAKMRQNVAEQLPELEGLGYTEITESNILRGAEFKLDKEVQACKQVFMPLACLPYENNLVYCFILSVWDNIIGPQTVQVWKRKSNPNRTKKSSIGGTALNTNLIKPQEMKNEETNCEQIGEKRLPLTSELKCSSLQVEINCQSRETSSSSAQRPSSAAAANSDAKRTGSVTNNEPIQQDHKQLRKSRLQSIVQYVTEHTVTLAQVHQQQQEEQQQQHHHDDEHQKLRPSLLVLPQHRIVVQAIRFVVTEEGNTRVPHCLCMVVPHDEEEQLLHLQHLTGGYLVRIVRHLHAVLTKGLLEHVGSSTAPRLQELCAVLVSLRRAALTRYPLMPQSPTDRQHALLLLTSHLTTAGYSVVTGDTSTAVNKVLMWLALFLPPSALHCSRLCIDPHHNTLQPGLLLQGLVLSGGASSISAARLLQFGRPVTLGDLGQRTVKRTLNHHPNREVLRDVTEVACVVRSFCRDHELLVGHPAHVRKGHVTAFKRCLQYQALAVIKWIQHNKSEKRNKLDSTLRELLGVNTASLDIVMTLVEELQPGLLQTLPS